MKMVERKGKLGDTPKPPAGRPLHPYFHSRDAENAEKNHYYWSLRSLRLCGELAYSSPLFPHGQVDDLAYLPAGGVVAGVELQAACAAAVAADDGAAVGGLDVGVEGVG